MNKKTITTLKIQNRTSVIEAVKENGVGTFVLSLADLSNSVFVNTRGSIVDGKSRVKTSPQHITNIARTLGDNRNNQQLQALNCALVESGDKDNPITRIGIYEGFTRFEAMSRNALASLIDEWNVENGLKEGDEDYIIPVNLEEDNDYVPDVDYEHEKQRFKIFEAGGEWQDKYVNCLKSYPIKVEIVRDITDKNAFTKGVVGNYARQKPPVWSMASNILTMINVYKMKGIEVAKQIGVTSALVSQYKAVAEIPDNLKRLIEKDEEVNTEDNKKILEVCVDEFIRRASLAIEDKCAIQISHSKTLATLLRNATSHKLTFARAIKLMKLLCCIDAEGRLNAQSQTLNLSVFEQHVESAKRAGEKVTEFDLTDGIEELLSTSVDIDDVASEQSEQEIESKKEEEKDENEDIINSLVEELGDAEETEESEDDDDLEDDDDVSTALTELIESDDDDSDLEDDDEDGDIENLVGSLLGEDDDEDDDSGAKKTQTIENIENKIVVKSPDKLMSKIMTAKLMVATFIDECEDENDPSSINWIEVIINLSSILTLSDVLNDKDTNNKYQEIVIRLSEAYNNFVSGMTGFCKAKMPAEKWNGIIKELSEFDRTSISDQ